MASKIGVSDTGPIIHLSEINQFRSFRIFQKVFVPYEIYMEVKSKKLPGYNEIDSKPIIPVHLTERERIVAEGMSLEYNLKINDATVIALSKCRSLPILLTDDLDVRECAKHAGIKTVGSIGILLRAYRENKLSYEKLIPCLDSLITDSSLFITPRLIKKVKKEVKRYRKK